ncbi:hypothetical protein B8W95_13570, partial [Staphylococcus pasteuri]
GTGDCADGRAKRGAHLWRLGFELAQGRRRGQDGVAAAVDSLARTLAGWVADGAGDAMVERLGNAGGVWSDSDSSSP